jgi:hypothetical protein
VGSRSPLAETVHGVATPVSKPGLPRSCCADALFTVTVTVAEVPMLSAASYALLESACDALLAVVVFQLHE